MNLISLLNQTISWLNTNQGLSQWIIAFVGIAAFWVAYSEFVLKRRPFIDFNLLMAENPDKGQGGWMFFASLINTGTYPGVVKVKKTITRVGDEEYPSEVKNEFIIAPGSSKKSALIGSIYKLGIDKIRTNQYKANRVELEIEI